MAKKKTILVVTACYDEPHRTMGSVPKISRQLSKHARVVVFSGGSSDRVEDRSKNLRVYFVKEWLIKDPVNNAVVPSMFKKLKEVLENEKPDAVLSVKYMFYPNLVVPYLKRKGYRVVTATDAFPGYSWFGASKLVNFVMWLYTRTLGKLILKKSEKVVLFHEGLVEDAKKLNLDYEVIHNGVEMDIIKKAKPKKLAGKINVIYVGRLESAKGYETILDAMKILTSKNKNVHFYHVGDLIGKEEIVSKYKSKQMHFEGRKNLQGVYSYLKGAQINLLASVSEGLPNVVIEGMMCETVPVSTKVGAVPFVIENGKLGRMFPYKNVKKLIKEVEWLIDNPEKRKKMAKLGKEKIKREYNWDTLAKKYYDTICAE